MFRSSRRALVIATSFSLGLSTFLAPAALAARSGGDDDYGEETAGLLDLGGLLGSLPVLGDTLTGLGVTDLLGGLGLPGVGEESLPSVEGIDLGGLGLPGLDGVGLPGLDGLGLPVLGELGLPVLDGLPLDAVLGGDVGGQGGLLGLGSLLGILDGGDAGGLNLNVLVDVGVTGALNLL
jgi:hypothetical protein